MSTPAVLGIVLAAYLLTCIRTWRKIDRVGLPTETLSGQARVKSPTLKAPVQK